MSNDEQAIRNLIEEWIAASRRHDVEAILKMMTDDVIFMTVGREPFGKEAFASMGKQQTNDTKIEGKSEIIEIQVFGDWAWMRNKLHVEITAPGAATMVKSGYILTVLKKNAEGKWQISRDANLLV